MERRKFLSAAALLALKPTFGNLYQSNPEFYLNRNADNVELWKDLRALFPLQKGRTYLNNGTMGITPYPVLQAVEQSFLTAATEGAYPGHSDELLKLIAGLTGVTADEITITKNVSEGTNHVCWGIPLKAGDEVILSTHEHVGGCLPWIHRSKSEGIVIKTFHPGKNAEETLRNFEKAITKKTRVVAVPHIPCTIGQILPVKEICALAKSKNIITAVDGAHPLGMIQFNIREIGCDYYYGCIHKWALGPLGTGFLYISKNILEKTKCTHIAAYSSATFNMTSNPPTMGELVPTASRFTYGTFSGPLFDGAIKALQLYNDIGPDKIEKRIRGLATYLQDKLLELGNKVEVITSTEAASRGAQISFRINNGNKKATQDFQSECNKKNIVIRYVGESDLDCLRVSTHYYNMEDEVDLLVDELKKYIGG
ncbi:MAG: aminotransferase class V-fold PLP-dependent enzyme [Bacteroidetes bacterium]|nr:aminotransferase class V-fold PLP-dependent enzyme [Bacteroidota bacterium]